MAHFPVVGNKDIFRERAVTPHVAQNTKRTGGSALERRTTRHPDYAVSQRKRKRIEEIVGGSNTVGLIRQGKLRGIQRIAPFLTLHTAAYNLVRMRSPIHPVARGKPEGLPPST